MHAAGFDGAGGTGGAGRLIRPADPSLLPPDKQAKWIFTARCWRDFNDDQKKRWKDWFAWATRPGGELWNEHEHGALLAGARLDDVDLAGVQLSHADLTGASLRSANLHAAKLQGAILERAHLEEATLAHVKLIGSTLSHAHLRGADLTGADLSEAILHHVDLTGVDLRDARLFATRITDPIWWVDLPRATMDGRTVFPRALPEHPIQDVLGLPPLLRRRIADAQYLRDMYRKAGGGSVGIGRSAMWVWGVTCCYGQSLGRWALSTVALLVFFSIAFVFMSFNFAVSTVEAGAASSAVHRPDFWQGMYFSVSTMMTLGLGDVAPASGLARVVVLIEEVCGYLMLGGLLSIFSNKLARLS